MFQRNLLALNHFVFVKNYFFRPFLFLSISELEHAPVSCVLQYKIFISTCFLNEVTWKNISNNKKFFQQFPLHIACMWFATSPPKTKHAFIYIKKYIHLLKTCFGKTFIWLFTIKAVLPEIWMVSNNTSLNQVSVIRN